MTIIGWDQKKNGIITLFQAIKKVTLIYNRTKWFFDIFWLFIELHFIKVIMILAFLLGINEVCLIPRNNSICNSNPLCLADFSHSYQCDFAECNCCNGTNKHSNSLQWIHFAHHRFSTHIANGLSDKIHTTERLWCQLHGKNHKMLDKLYTEINVFVQDKEFTIVRSSMVDDNINNTANWLGFNKMVTGQTLIQYLSGYIVYIVALSAFNLVSMHQYRKRSVICISLNCYWRKFIQSLFNEWKFIKKIQVPEWQINSKAERFVSANHT